MLLDLIIGVYVIGAVVWFMMFAVIFAAIFSVWAVKGEYGDALGTSMLWALSAVIWPLALIYGIVRSTSKEGVK